MTVRYTGKWKIQWYSGREPQRVARFTVCLWVGVCPVCPVRRPRLLGCWADNRRASGRSLPRFSLGRDGPEKYKLDFSGDDGEGRGARAIWRRVEEERVQRRYGLQKRNKKRLGEKKVGVGERVWCGMGGSFVQDELSQSGMGTGTGFWKRSERLSAPFNGKLPRLYKYRWV